MDWNKKKKKKKNWKELVETRRKYERRTNRTMVVYKIRDNAHRW